MYSRKEPCTCEPSLIREILVRIGISRSNAQKMHTFVRRELEDNQKLKRYITRYRGSDQFHRVRDVPAVRRQVKRLAQQYIEVTQLEADPTKLSLIETTKKLDYSGIDISYVREHKDELGIPQRVGNRVFYDLELVMHLIEKWKSDQKDRWTL